MHKNMPRKLGGGYRCFRNMHEEATSSPLGISPKTEKRKSIFKHLRVSKFPQNRFPRNRSRKSGKRHKEGREANIGHVVKETNPMEKLGAVLQCTLTAVSILLDPSEDCWGRGGAQEVTSSVLAVKFAQVDGPQESGPLENILRNSKSK